VVPYLTLMTEEAPQREHDLREVFDAMRWIVRTARRGGIYPTTCPVVGGLPASPALDRGRVFVAMIRDLRELLRMLNSRDPSRRLRSSTVAHSSRRRRAAKRAGYDGAKRKKGSKVHLAVDTLGHLLALHVTPADEQDRQQVGKLAKAVQKETGKSVELAFVDQDTPERRQPRPRARRRSNCRW